MKSLSEMSLEELWELFPIVIKDYYPHYPSWYTEEETALVKLLRKDTIIRINHIGSTAVVGIKSKPIIDVLLELSDNTDISSLKKTLQEAGWTLMSESEEPLNLVFNKGYTLNGFAEKIFHLHIRYLGDWNELYFKDYLNEFPEVRNDYEKLKLSLKEKYEHNRNAYTESKTDFIKMHTTKSKAYYKNKYNIMNQ